VCDTTEWVLTVTERSESKTVEMVLTQPDMDEVAGPISDPPAFPYGSFEALLWHRLIEALTARQLQLFDSQ